MVRLMTEHCQEDTIKLSASQIQKEKKRCDAMKENLKRRKLSLAHRSQLQVQRGVRDLLEQRGDARGIPETQNHGASPMAATLPGYLEQGLRELQQGQDSQDSQDPQDSQGHQDQQETQDRERQTPLEPCVEGGFQPRFSSDSSDLPNIAKSSDLFKSSDLPDSKDS